MKLTKTRLIFMLAIGLLSATLHSCKDEPDPPAKDLGFFGLGEAKDYVYFKKGTWWVYQNTRTGEYDTIEVYFNLLDTLEATSKKWHFTQELFLTQSRSLSTGHIYTFYERLGAVEVTDQPTGFIVPTLERFNPYEGEINPFYYPFDQIKDKSGEYKAYCLSIKDTMNINGKIYNKVAVFYLKGDVIEPVPRNGWPAKYYWTKNYGVIQKDLFEPTFFGDTSALYHSWKLINSNIKQ